MIKDTKIDPLPQSIREFKYMWLKEQYQCYSDRDISDLLLIIINSRVTELREKISENEKMLKFRKIRKIIN